MRRTLTAATVLTFTAAALTGCSGGGKSATASSAAGQTPQELLQTAQKTLNDTSGVHIKLTSANVPKSANLLGGEGDGSHAPNFKGTITLQVLGATLNVPVIATGGKVWAKTPLSQSMQVINPSTYGAPDPSVLLSSNDGFSSLLTQTQSPTFGAKKRDGKDIVQQVTGSLSGQALKLVLSIGNPQSTYKVDYEITDGGQLRTATIDGAFYSGTADTTYTITLTNYGQKVVVTAP